MGGHHPEVAGGYPSLLCHDWGRNPSQPDVGARRLELMFLERESELGLMDGPQQHVTHNTHTTNITHVTG
jgi:hypothetical protein